MSARAPTRSGGQSPFGDAADYAASSIDRPLREQFSGRCAVVTGSTQGLGLAATELMIRRGLAGAVICGRNIAAGEAEARRLSALGARVVYQHADLGHLDDCESVVDRAHDEFGQVDILVNSAGITDRGGILDGDRDLWQRTMDINARAPFFLMQRAARLMSAAGRPGAIVNVASVTAYGGVPFLCVYAASKAALIAITKNAAFSLAGNGIRINGLAIGWMDTPAEDVTQRRYHHGRDGWQEEAGRQLPAGRLLSMNEVARWIAHLASAELGIMTGSVIDFDHGVIGAYEATPLPAMRA